MKNTRRRANDDLRKEYNFATMAGGARGNYVERLAAGRSRPTSRSRRAEPEDYPAVPE